MEALTLMKGSDMITFVAQLERSDYGVIRAVNRCNYNVSYETKNIYNVV